MMKILDQRAVRIGMAAMFLAFSAAVPAFAQTTASTVPSSAAGTAFADIQFQLALLTVQVQALANTPIVTTADKGQALTILQSVVRVLRQLNAELQ